LAVHVRAHLDCKDFKVVYVYRYLPVWRSLYHFSTAAGGSKENVEANIPPEETEIDEKTKSIIEKLNNDIKELMEKKADIDVRIFTIFSL